VADSQRTARNAGLGWRLYALLALALTLAGCAAAPNAASQSRQAGVSTSTTTIPSSEATSATGPPSAIWDRLAARPLRLPMLAPGDACPITPARERVSPDFPYAQGSGPVYAIATNASGTVTFNSAASLGDAASGYGGFKAFWEIQPTYSGPALIRGARLDGPGALAFNGGLGQASAGSSGMEPRLSALRIDGQPVTPPAWPTWVTFTRLASPGCYAYQVDGTSFEEIIIFQALAG
jgi:hypothetical protein